MPTAALIYIYFSHHPKVSDIFNNHYLFIFQTIQFYLSNGIQRCTLCSCKGINNHIKHSDTHKFELIKMCCY